MKQGHGRLQRADGSVYEGAWEANIIVGTGRVTIAVGDKSKRDGLPKEVCEYQVALLPSNTAAYDTNMSMLVLQITLKVFGY
jgi:hypothetical protein